MSDAPRCSVVIRAFNEEEHIGRLLSGILEQTVRPVEVLLVDSGSTDATLAIAARFPVRVLSIRPEAFSFGRSLNIGCRAARGEIIVIASAHVYPVYPDWLEQLLAPYHDPAVGLVYGRQRGGGSTKFSEHQILAKWFPDGSTARQDHPFCNNANAAIRRRLWEQRPYNEDLPGLEDVDWASWALSQGHAVAYRAEAEVAHVHNESPGAVFNRYRREGMALRTIRPQEHFRFVDFVRLVVSNVVSDLWHAGHERRLPKVAGEILWFRWMQFWGTYRGFRQAGPLTGVLKQTFYYPRGFGRPEASARREVAPIDYHRAGSARLKADTFGREPALSKARRKSAS
ncbi:MAG: family 2 glycosyl transferase [Chloroflexi bacterium RBG_13_68_17]|nr:MAG: family 2 glycosyl transferase [Chloroflexi bacterium RBG_13_68_17]